MNFSNIKNKLNFFWNIKISSKNKIAFLEQLSNLLNSGIPIINALKIMSYQSSDKNIKKIIKTTIENINKWLSLKDSFKKYNKIFSNFDTSIIEMWEKTWKLWKSIEIVKLKEEKEKELRWKILWAMIYPMIIITLATIMIFVFMIYVIPKITDMYKDAKVNLPELTQTVINISNFLQNNIIEIIISIFIFIFLFSIFKTNSKTKIYYDKLILSIPLFWNLIQKKILSLLSSNMWILLSSWILINESLKISSWALENAYYEKEINKIIDWISQWKDLSETMWINEINSKNKNKYFPVDFSSTVKIWEQTWNLAKLLSKLSIKYNKEIDNIVKNLSTAIEPTVIVIVWIIIWTLIMAIMLPFFNMVNVIK